MAANRPEHRDEREPIQQFALVTPATARHIVASWPKCRGLLVAYIAFKSWYSPGDEESCFPGLPEVATRAGCSVRTLNRYIGMLKGCGVMEVKQRRRKSNVYTFPEPQAGPGAGNQETPRIGGVSKPPGSNQETPHMRVRQETPRMCGAGSDHLPDQKETTTSSACRPNAVAEAVTACVAFDLRLHDEQQRTGAVQRALSASLADTIREGFAPAGWQTIFAAVLERLRDAYPDDQGGIRRTDRGKALRQPLALLLKLLRLCRDACLDGTPPEDWQLLEGMLATASPDTVAGNDEQDEHDETSERPSMKETGNESVHARGRLHSGG